MKFDFFFIFYQVILTGGKLFKQDWCRNRLQGISFKEIGTSYLKNQKIPQVPCSVIFFSIIINLAKVSLESVKHLGVGMGSRGEGKKGEGGGVERRQIGDHRTRDYL